MTVQDLRSRPSVHAAASTLVVLVLATAVAAAPLAGISPLLVGAVPLALVAGRELLRSPRAALQVAVITVLLPDGLLPTAGQRPAELLTLLLAVAAHLRRTPRPVPVVGAPVALLALFLVWAMLSATWSARPLASLEMLRPYVLAFALLLLIVNVVRSRDDVPALMDALAVAGWVLLICSVWTLATGFDPGARLSVLDMNANQVGNHLLVTTAGVLWRQLWAPSAAHRRRRMVQTVVFLGASLVVIAATGSRGSLLAFGILVLSFGVTRPLRAWAAAGLAVSAVLLALFPAAFLTVHERVTEPDPDQLSRAQLWRAGLALIADHPFGVGLGQGPLVLPSYINDQVPDDHFQNREDMPAHNAVIEVGTDTGVIGAALFSGALVLAAGSCLASVRRGHRSGDDRLITYGAVVGTTSVAFLAAWVKSGGESYNVTTFLLVALWVAPARASRHPVPESAPGP